MSKPKLSLKSKGYRTLTHLVPTDDDAVVAFRAADEALNKARLRNTPGETLADLEKARADAEVRVRDTTLVVRMRALPQHEYAKLKAAHPPNESDHEEVRESSGDPKAKARWHTETFGPALVAACMIEPEKLTVEEATALAQEWNEAEWNGLLFAAMTVNGTSTPTVGLVFS